MTKEGAFGILSVLRNEARRKHRIGCLRPSERKERLYMMETCVLCRNKFSVAEGEEPAILYVNRFGNPRALCASCETLLDIAISGEPEREEARKTVMKNAFNIREEEGLAVLKETLEGDLTPHEFTEEEIAEEKALYEDEEDEEPEEEAPAGIGEYIPLICFGAALVAFVVWFFFLR